MNNFDAAQSAHTSELIAFINSYHEQQRVQWDWKAKYKKKINNETYWTRLTNSIACLNELIKIRLYTIGKNIFIAVPVNVFYTWNFMDVNLSCLVQSL